MAPPAEKHFTIDDDESTIISEFTDLDSTQFSFASPTESRTTPATVTRKRKQTATNTWDHARKPYNDELERAATGQRIFYCKHCSKYKTVSTSSARYHLEHDHKIVVTTQPTKAQKARHERLDATFGRATANQQQ